ncbi:MAG: ATP-binding cassette domain-containing protein [Rickettsiales bacterium]|nr:ATP-binding cassette domain-containing protein [Rickettsiales bacterium]
MTAEKPQKKPLNLKNLSALIPFFKPYKREIIFALLALLITAATVLFFGKVIKYLIDFGFAQKNQHFFNLVLLTFVAAVIIMAVAGFYRSSLVNAVAEKVIADLRKKVYDHIIRVSAEFFEITKTGDVISRLTVDSAVLYGVISNTTSFFLRNSLFFIGGICFLFFTSVKLSLMSMMLIPIAIAPIIVMGRKVKNLSHQSQAALASVGAHIEESINGIKTIQSYSCEEKEARNFFGFVDNSLKISLEKIRIKSLMVALVIASAFGGIAVVLWVGGHDVLSGKITSGELSSFIFYSVITATSLVSLSQIAGQLQSASAAAARIFELLEIRSPVREADSAQLFADTKEITINFHDVSFAYPSRKDFSVLKNFNLEIKPREKIAFVGSSGSGKSTAFQLLMRFYDIDFGEISLNGFDVKSLSLADLRKNFSYISQDCFIFSGTIFENIAYADLSITEAQVEQIIAQNPALHFINNLPQKMHSFVGEKGIKLSGGERQRIAIARAIIKDSPILLLDEATSALDNENSKNIAREITNLAANKTVITIAHKLSSVIAADRIIFIKDGKIAEIGSHQELMDLGGFYKKMYEVESLEIV